MLDVGSFWLTAAKLEHEASRRWAAMHGTANVDTWRSSNAPKGPLLSTPVMKCMAAS